MEEQKSRKYVTLNEGVDFRTIAKIMSRNNFRMNHATARNQLIVALQMLLTSISHQVKGSKVKNSDIINLLKNQTIHDQLGEILYLAHKQNEAESKQLKKEPKNED